MMNSVKRETEKRMLTAELINLFDMDCNLFENFRSKNNFFRFKMSKYHSIKD